MRTRFARLMAAAIATVSILAAWGTASAAPYVLVADYRRTPQSGTLSSLFFKSGTAQGCPAAAPFRQPCYNPANPFVIANTIATQVQAAGLATWDWNGTTMTGTGLLWSTSFTNANSLGQSISSSKATNLTLTPTTLTTTATTYECIEGEFLASVNVNSCIGVELGVDGLLQSTIVYNVGGDPSCVNRTIVPDDQSNAGPRGLFNAVAGGGCDGMQGAYNHWIVVPNPRFLILSEAPNIIGADGCYMFGRASEKSTSPCAPDVALALVNYLIFAPAVDADSDGVVDALDNCRTLSNATQVDSDGDGFGNRCDGDLNGNGSTDAQDTTLYRQQLGQPSVAPTFNAADINANGSVNAQDTTLFRQLVGSPPGPSGLCNGIFPCPANP